jgi:hypothetical protein
LTNQPDLQVGELRGYRVYRVPDDDLL